LPKETFTQKHARAIDELVARAGEAYLEYLDFNQESIDNIVRLAALAGLEQHMELAEMAVEETGRGIYEDKVIKNIFATEYVYHDIKNKKTVGKIKEDLDDGYIEIAEPAGVIAALTPVTNPTSTTLFKSLIALKTRNPIIFSFHPAAQRCSAAAARVIREAAVKAGAPAACIQWLETPTVEGVQYLLHHPRTSLILATGGMQMVQAAYSAGKPALGVGPGNVPCFIERSANLRRAVTDLIMSKTFDHGMVCASEQALIVDRDVAVQVIELMQELGCVFLQPRDVERLEKLVTKDYTTSLNADVVGKSAAAIAEMAGISVPPETKILVAPQTAVGPEAPLSREKLSPILAFYTVDGYRQGIERSVEMINFGGLGHSAVIHSEDEQVIAAFAGRLRVGRVIVNSPATHGAIGDLYNALTPSLTLGCGYVGNNSTTANVSVLNLINIKRVARRRVNMQWFKVPPKIFFERGALRYLAKMPDIRRAVIVTDPVLRELGYVERVVERLEERAERVNIEVFDEVEPNPSLATVKKGCELLKRFAPDTIIAVGGGSVIDAAKGMWLFYEHPEVEFEFLRLKFLDIRKRTYKYPRAARKTRLVAVPTTSGSGSEVTAFAVITDRGSDIKYPLADYELTPDVAIIDPELALGQPPGLTVDTGMDVLAHALEAYVSVMASDYTDALAVKAIQLVFEYLPRAAGNPQDLVAREKMHNAATIAGMAFTNAFLGVNHSLSHKLGGEFDIPHGRANAVLMPYVIAYNASRPAKITAWPKYEFYQAAERYRDIARALGLRAGSPQEGVDSLIRAVRNLMRELGLPETIAALGIDEGEFLKRVPEIAKRAFEDQTTVTNPRMPLVKELEDILRRAYYGRLEYPDAARPETPGYSPAVTPEAVVNAPADNKILH